MVTAAGRSRLWTVAIAIAALLQFCLFLNHRDITTAHEGRVAATAREMLHRRDWIVPYCNGVPRVAKPPLPYWTTMIAWCIAGREEVWLARLPAAILGAIAVLLVMDLARRVLGRNASILAGIVWVSTWFIVDEYRKAMADPYLAFFTLLSVWAWVAADQAKAKASRLLYLVCYISAGLGALAKGQLILLHLALAIVPYQLLKRRLPRRPWAHVIGIIIMLLIALPWPIYMLRHVPNTAKEWAEDSTGAYATTGAKSSSVFQYVLSVPQMAAPWSVLLLIGTIVTLRGPRRRQRRALWPLMWLIATVIVFTCVPMKKNAYLLPMMPAQTLLIAAALAQTIRVPRATKDAAIERFVLTAHLVAAIVALAVIVYLTLSLERFEIESPAPLLAASAIGLFLLLGIRQLAPRVRSLRTITVTALLFAIAVHGAEAWVVADFDNRRSDRSFAEILKKQKDAEELVLIGPGLREDVLFYLGQTVRQFDSIEQLPGDYKGVAIVTVEQIDNVRRSDRGDELDASSSPRSDKDKLYAFRFPKGPPAPPRERR